MDPGWAELWHAAHLPADAAERPALPAWQCIALLPPDNSITDTIHQWNGSARASYLLWLSPEASLSQVRSLDNCNGYALACFVICTYLGSASDKECRLHDQLQSLLPGTIPVPDSGVVSAAHGAAVMPGAHL